MYSGDFFWGVTESGDDRTPGRPGGHRGMEGGARVQITGPDPGRHTGHNHFFWQIYDREIVLRDHPEPYDARAANIKVHCPTPPTTVSGFGQK
jgi:hypothetical protein